MPWKLHCGLAVTLSCDTPDVEVQQLQRFPPIGKVFALPQCWSIFHEVDGPFSIPAIQITGLGSDLARWASQTEQYLTQNLHKPTTGRGHLIQLRKAPLVDQIWPQVSKKGQLAYWERMAVRVNILHQTSHKKVASDLESMLNTLSANATEDMEQDLFATILRTWIKEPHNDPTEIKGYIHNQELQAHQALLSSGNVEFKAWLEKAHAQGLRGLFRNLRQRDIPWQRPFQDLPALDRLRAREEPWGEIWWLSEGPCHIRGYQALKAAAVHHAMGMPPIDSSVLQKVLRKLPNKAAGPDGIFYDFPRHLPYPAVNKLAQLLTEMESTATLPTQLTLTNIVMIPKNTKVERPIALTSCLYRVWNRYRKQDLHEWQLTLDEELPWDKARPQQDCLSIAIGRMLKAEISKHQGIHTVSCLADLSCFYDTVNLDHIIEPGFCASNLHWTSMLVPG